MALKLIHIGVGIRGRQWMQFVKEYSDIDSAACVDAEPGSLNEVQKRFGENYCPRFQDLEAALKNVKADAALIASPPFLHSEHTLRCLDAGLGILLEKPFACTVPEGQRIIERAEAVGKPVVIAEQFRFVPAERTVRRFIEEGQLGEILNVNFVDRRRMPSRTQGSWMATMRYPQLQEIAVHHFDSLRSFFQRRPLSIMARVWNPSRTDYVHGACTQALIEMEGCLHINYLGCLASNKFSYGLWIEGERGLLWTNRKFVWWRAAGKRLPKMVKLVKVPKGDEAPFPKEGSTTLLNSLRDALLYRKKAETSADDNIWTIAMVEAGKRSAEEQRVVAIEEVLTGKSATRLMVETKR
jgi:predicted dehydrogenase